jgi:hypothetical protein
MDSISIDLTELCEVVRACDAIQIDDCTPAYLQDFIAGRLADSAPELSTKIRALDSHRIDLLCECIKATQAVLRW